MRSLAMILVVLLFGAQASAGNTSLRVSKTLTKLGAVVAVPVLGLTLATAPLHRAVAQGKAEEELTAVVADDPAYRHGAVLLRVSVPAAEGEEEGVEYAFHLGFIGINADGNSLLVGRERASGNNVGEKLVEASNASLYGWDGMLADNLTVRAIDSFEDSTGDSIYNVVLLEVEDVNLAENYPPLALDDSFPYTQARAMEALTYRLRYSPVLNEEELAADSFTLRWLKCGSVPHAKLAILDNGFTTCGVIGKDLPNGALLIHDGKLVALQSLDSPTLRDEHDNPLVWLASGIPARAANFSQALGDTITPVNPAGKLASTWGAIKAPR